MGDSAMGLCLCDAFLKAEELGLKQPDMENPNEVSSEMLGWMSALGYLSMYYFNLWNWNSWNSSGGAAFGLGGNISKGVNSFRDAPAAYSRHGNFILDGNGGLMRNAASVAAFNDDLNKALLFGAMQSMVTHQGRAARQCAYILTWITHQGIHTTTEKDEAKNHNKLKEFLTVAPRNFFGEELSPAVVQLLESRGEFNWRVDFKKPFDLEREDGIVAEVAFEYNIKRHQMDAGHNVLKSYAGSYALDALAMAFHILWNVPGFYNAIVCAANLRGDSDSVAAIVGQIAPAFYYVDGDREKINELWKYVATNSSESNDLLKKAIDTVKRTAK